MVRRILWSIAAAGLAASGPAHAEWYEGSSKHFVVYANTSADQVKAMTTNLERYDKAVRVALKLREPEVSPNARVTVYVLPTVDAVQKMLGQSNVGGFYKDLPSGPIAFIPAFDADGTANSLTPRMTLQHEYAHHVMYSSFGDVVFPTWFSEGFAELFATTRIRSDGSAQIGAIPLYRSYGIDQMNVVPVERLVKSGPNMKNGLEGQVYYGRAWLLAHYLIFDKDRAKLLADYIGAINSGKTRDEANQILGISPALDIKLNSYAKQPKLPSAMLSADLLPIDNVTTRPLTPGEAAAMPAQMRSQNGVDEKAAKDVVVQARDAATRFPNDAATQNELAEAEFDAGNYAASEAAADRALAANPQSIHAMIYKGMAMQAQLEKAKTADPAAWQAARKWYLAANKADPLYSLPIQKLYESYAAAGQAPSKGARNGLLYAYQLAPHNRELRVEAATVLMEDGNLKAARVALEPIAFSEEGGKIAEAATKALAALDKGDTEGAKAALKANKADGTGNDGKKS